MRTTGSTDALLVVWEVSVTAGGAATSVSVVVMACSWLWLSVRQALAPRRQ
jgi:hypothetical protein